MRRLALLVLVFLGISLPVAAQGYSKADLAIDYSFSHFNSSDNNSGSVNGFDVNPAVYFFKIIGIEADFGYGHAGSYTQGNGSTVDASINSTHFLIGPRVRFRVGPITPFVQVHFGGVDRHAVTNSEGFTSASTGDPIPAGVLLSDNQINYAIGAGGGFDFKLIRHVALRAQYNWLRTDFTVNNPAEDPVDNNNGVSVGIVFK